MTMNGDHPSVATAPLDLRTTNRERGGAGSRTPDGGLQRTRQQGRSPAAPACTGTGSLDRSLLTGAAHKRTADNSSLKLPFRKRPIPVEPETPSQAAAPAERGERVPLVEASDLVYLSACLGDSGFGAAAREATGQSAEKYHMRLFHPIHYSHYPVCYLPSVLEPDHHLAHQREHLPTSIALATRQDEDGDTALHIAVVQGELAIVCRLIHLLLWAHKGLDTYNNLRQTPLHLAVITQQVEMVGVLLKEGADPVAQDRNGQTAVHLCCEYNQRDCLAVLLSHAASPVCLDIRNYEGLSPIHLAVLQGHRDLTRMLLDAGGDINAKDIKSGQTPLMHAVENNNVDMVYFLIENGCDVNSQSCSGNTALHGACGRGQVDTVRLLLKSGADSSLKNYHNETAVMVANNKKIADVLRGRGSKLIRDPHYVSVSPHGSNLSENGSPSSCQSRGCSPLSMPHTPHRSTSHSPKTPSIPVYPFY